MRQAFSQRFHPLWLAAGILLGAFAADAPATEVRAGLYGDVAIATGFSGDVAIGAMTRSLILPTGRRFPAPKRTLTNGSARLGVSQARTIDVCLRQARFPTPPVWRSLRGKRSRARRGRGQYRSAKLANHRRQALLQCRSPFSGSQARRRGVRRKLADGPGQNREIETCQSCTEKYRRSSGRT